MAPKLSAAFFAALVLAQAALGHWEVVSSAVEPGGPGAVAHRHVVLHDAAADVDATLDLAIFSPTSAKLRVIDNASAHDDLATAMARGKFAAGVNGGYFDTNFRPLGLRVIDAATTSPLTRARLLTGVLCAGPGEVKIVRVGEFSRRRKWQAVVECGPFLVNEGKGVANLNNQKSARRTFAAVVRAGNAALGVSSELTLAQAAALLATRSLANDFPIWQALNLDGGSSSAFWFRKNDGRVFSISEDKTVRDFVGVSAK
jgi:uncharacterized protein YigE (DUF2233 family)